MLMMENAEEVHQALERFTKLKQTQIPSELEDYLCFVAKSGDTIFRWAVIKALFREKLIAVIKQFHEQTAIDDLPHYPNVDPFNYETMKTALLERLESFSAAPFTVQRICELLTDPRKQYSRIDKFMRAIEKNILVVSTTEPGREKSLADSSDYSDSLDSMVNGSSNVTGGALGDDLAGDIDVDIELENGQAAGGAALPSINTLNSAILAANQTVGPAVVVAAVAAAVTEDLLSHAVLNDEDVEEEDDDDDEDVVHNHLTTDPTEETAVESSSSLNVGSEVTPEVATEAVEKDVKSPAKKRADKEAGDAVDNVKRAKLAEKEDDQEVEKKDEEEKKTAKETIPEKVEEEATEIVIKAAASAPAVESSDGAGEVPPTNDEKAAEETCEKEAKDLQSETKVEGGEGNTLVEAAAAPVVDDVAQVSAVAVEQVATESEKKVDEIPSETTTATVLVPPVVEPIVADAEKVVIPSSSSVAAVVEEEEAMDDKPIESLDAMEAETETTPPIAASEMDVDSSEGIIPTATTLEPAAIVSEESVSMDEPMEDQ